MKTPAKLFFVAGAAIALLLIGYFQGYVHGVTGGEVKGMLADANAHSESIQAQLANLRGATKLYVGQLNITIKEKPFGMHVRRGSVVVEEVFPGFPAEKLGIRAGCEVQEIAGEKVKQGTWVQAFQKAATPFRMLLNCPADASKGHGPMAIDGNKYRALVVKRPFGMNIQVNPKGNKLPRVIEVLPGSAAEAAGVKRGYVLTHVAERAVAAGTWFDIWNNATLPCTLTFDTSNPVHESNPHFNDDAASPAASGPASNLPDGWEGDAPVAGFRDVWVTVKQLPFGLAVDAPPGKLPLVKAVSPGMPAAEQDIKPGDVLLKVAGERVDSSTWFAAFQHAVPPFGLHFRRPDRITRTDDDDMPLPIMPVFGDLEVTVDKKPFGMSVKRSSLKVVKVFPGFPAEQAGIRVGCELRKIASQETTPGNWMDLFQSSQMPFGMKLFCPRAGNITQGTASADGRTFRVAVKERPFGMNVQVNKDGSSVPRVVEVLPGYPAEAAGVKAGFVLTHINEEAVDGHTWFEIWQKQSAGAMLTFDTSMPVHPSNQFIAADGEDKKASPPVDESATDIGEGFTDFKCAVQKLPFGFEIHTPKGQRPTVKSVASGSPAEAAGVKVGDVLVEVSGLPVTASSWFKAYQQAATPFGIAFRRPSPERPRNADEQSREADATEKSPEDQLSAQQPSDNDSGWEQPPTNPASESIPDAAPDATSAEESASAAGTS